MMVPEVELPAGCRLDPEDEELIKHYLGPKVRGEQQPHLGLIAELDVYATEPWNLGIELRHGKNGDAFFCFTRVARSVASNGRLLRGAGNGTWHASGKRTPIRCNGEVAGQKMTNLKFMLRAKKGGKPVATCWIMHEYRLLNPPIDDQGREMVLYRIHKSGTGLSNDNQLSCLDDFPASAANQQLQKRKRDEIHCCDEMAAGTMTSRNCTPTPPPYIAGDEQPESTDIPVWEDSLEINKGSVIQSQPMLQPPCSDDGAASLLCYGLPAACPPMRTMTSLNTPSPCIVGDEQLESMRMDRATCFRTTSTSDWENSVDVGNGLVVQSQPIMQPLGCDDHHALQPEEFMIQSPAGSSTTSTSLWKSDWDEADFRNILDMVEKMVQ